MDAGEGEGKRFGLPGMRGTRLTGTLGRQALSDRLALKPYWGKPTVRNFRGGDGDVGIIEARSAPSLYPTDRMTGAARLDVQTYEEVEADTGATGQAMGVVLLSSIVGGIGSVGLGAGGVIMGSVAALIGWVAWAFLTYFIGTRLLAEPQTRADAGELMRTLRFAQSPGLVRIVGIVPGIGPLVFAIVSIWILVAMVIAVRQALDYTSTLRAVGVCLVGWTVSGVISFLFFGLVVS